MDDELVHREPSPNCDERALPVSMVVLHYTGMRARGGVERMLDPAAQGQRALHDRRGRHGLPAGPRGQARLARRAQLLARDHRCQLGQHRDRAGQSRARIRLSRVPRRADGGADPAARRDRDAPRHPARQHRRPFGHRPGAQGGSGRAVRLGRARRIRLALPRPTKSTLGDPFDNDGAFLLALERFGYDISDGRKAVVAFQRRWRPSKIDGVVDGEIGAMLFQLLLDRDRGKTR